jgi:GNAT superfamily N-acetyltransferase
MKAFSSIKVIKSAKGHLIKIMPYEEEYFESLVSMYDTHYPLGSVQGLPPPDAGKRRQWVHDMIIRGMNLVALNEDNVIGHVTLFSIQTNRVEYFIFIHQDFQRQGIGTAMTLYAIDWALQKNISTIWLCVERKNCVAISLYNKLGFKRIASEDSEWEMTLTLKQE